MTEDAAYLRSQAMRCRRLAATVSTKDVAETLLDMAKEYEERAERLEQAGKRDPEPESPA